MSYVCLKYHRRIILVVHYNSYLILFATNLSNHFAQNWCFKGSHIQVTKEFSVIKSKLQATVSEDFYLRPCDFGIAKKHFILQRWSSQWDSF